jgi:outer membrane protein OmpA-like peptidoglycan-associated protein
LAGPAGAIGVAGEAGPQGAVGATGPQGPTGYVPEWTFYRDFRFDYNQGDIQASHSRKISEIARYLKKNPSLKIAIDGSMDPRGKDPRNQDLCDRRVNAIREALVKAGVPENKIQVGAFGKPQLAQDRRVAVLVRTDN